jgi:hypothetical protein
MTYCSRDKYCSPVISAPATISLLNLAFVRFIVHFIAGRRLIAPCFWTLQNLYCSESMQLIFAAVQ